MAGFHLVRVGAMARVGRFSAIDAVRYPRGARVVVRTARGLEAGEVLAAPAGESRLPPDGAIVRGMTAEDELLEIRLRKHRETAYAACVRRLDEAGLDVGLVDVEHLFDGRTLVFYFLGEPRPEFDSITAELTTIYGVEAHFQSFADALTHGCGPDCGIGEAPSGGCQNCATGCAVAGACSTQKPGSKGTR